MHPADKYIRFMLARRWPIEDDEEKWIEAWKGIERALKSYNLPSSSSFADRIKESFQPPTSFAFHNKEHKETAEFMKQEGIYSLWIPGPDEKKMLQLMTTNKPQRIIRILLMGGVELDQIVKKVALLLRDPSAVSERILQLYMHYVWDYERVMDGEWSDILWSFPYRDSYMQALNGSKENAMWRCGFSPKVDTKTSLRDAHRLVYFRLESTRWMPDSKETSEIVTKYTKELVALHNTLSTGGEGHDDMLRRFRSFLLKSEEQNTPGVQEVTKDGSYSK